MGGGQSKGGGLRRQVRPLVPRAWAEVEQLRVRFQQEARRRRSDPEAQHFLAFSAFHAIAAPLCPSAGKTEFLAMFQALDRKRRGRIAAIDLFSGLALVVEAKKAQKLDFLMSLVENGGCKTLNRCELTIVLSAAARGLAMFTMMPEPHRDAMKPLVRRLMGEEQEMARQSIVDKALVDAEILFFMNDLEGGAGTSEELLIQQAKLLSRMAFLDLQTARVSNSVERSKAGSALAAPVPGVGPSERDGAARPRVPASIDVLIRKLQHLVCPPVQENTHTTAFSETSRTLGGGDAIAAAVNPSEVKKHVDTRTIQRLVARISDGGIPVSVAESQRLVSKLSVDEFGLVRCGELFRSVSAWLHANWQDDQVPLWKRVARFAANQANRFIFTLNSGLTAIGSRAMRDRARAKAHRASTNHEELSLQDDAELNWSINVQVGGVSNSASVTEQSPDLVTQKTKTVSETIKFRVGLHPPETALVDVNDPTSNDLDEEDSGMRLIMCFTLRNDISIEDAMDLASSVERFLEHADVMATLPDIWQAVRGESTQNTVNTPLPRRKQLRVYLVLSRDWFCELEDHSTIDFSSHIQRLFILGEASSSLEDLVNASLQVVGFLRSLTKSESREALLRSEFERFDVDKSGDWNLQEFNSFQQALGKVALDEDAVQHIFSTEASADYHISFDMFADLYKNCSAAEMLTLFQALRVGSLDRLIEGSAAATCIVRRSLLRQITQKMLSPLRWSDSWLKRILFLGQSSSDFSYDTHLSTISSVLELFGASVPAFLTDPMFVSNCVEKLSSLAHPPHQEHARDRPCESLWCSLAREVEKNTPYRTERDDQGSTRGTFGSTGREESAIDISLRAVALAVESVLGPETIEIRGKRLRMMCEFDNLVARPRGSGGSGAEVVDAV